jgi:hypothetical protein
MQNNYLLSNLQVLDLAKSEWNSRLYFFPSFLFFKFYVLRMGHVFVLHTSYLISWKKIEGIAAQTRQKGKKITEMLLDSWRRKITLQELARSCGLMNETGNHAYCSKKYIAG